jgi:hypothetical protein
MNNPKKRGMAHSNEVDIFSKCVTYDYVYLHWSSCLFAAGEIYCREANRTKGKGKAIPVTARGGP